MKEGDGCFLALGKLVLGVPFVVAISAASNALEAWEVGWILRWFTPWTVGFWPLFGLSVAASITLYRPTTKDYSGEEAAKALFMAFLVPFVTFAIAWLINLIR